MAAILALIFPAETILPEPEQTAIVQEATAVEINEADAEMLARLIYTEARGVESRDEQAAVAWCVLNRVDDDRWPDMVAEVVTQKGQFAYDKDAPIEDELYDIAVEVLTAWTSSDETARTLPREYVFFSGRNGHNYFRDAYKGGNTWNFMKGGE